jgi:hypothetical protein
MPMAVLLVLIAMAHQRNIVATSLLLNQPQSELLAVILDPLVGSIETNAAVEQLPTGASRKFSPGRRTALQKPFAHCKGVA